MFARKRINKSIRRRKKVRPRSLLSRPMFTKSLILCLIMLLTVGTSMLTFGGAKKSVEREKGETVLTEDIIMQQFGAEGSSDSFGNVTLTWEADPDCSGYVVYRYNETTKTYDAIATIKDPEVNTFEDEATFAGSTYCYQVTPLFALKEMKNSEVVYVQTKVDKPHVEVSTDYTTAEVTWNAIDSAEEYDVFRSTERNGEYQKVASTTDTSFTDDNLTPETTYYYAVQAKKGKKPSTLSTAKSTGEIQDDTSYHGGKMVHPLPAITGISSYFGYRIAPTWGATSQHDGIDMTGPYGSPILSVAGGVVTKVSYDGGRGNYVIVDHGNGYKTLYQHMSDCSVAVGEQVAPGDVVGHLGNTGASTGPHLHFELFVNETPVDPLPYLKK